MRICFGFLGRGLGFSRFLSAGRGNVGIVLCVAVVASVLIVVCGGRGRLNFSVTGFGFCLRVRR